MFQSGKDRNLGIKFGIGRFTSPASSAASTPPSASQQLTSSKQSYTSEKSFKGEITSRNVFGDENKVVMKTKAIQTKEKKMLSKSSQTALVRERSSPPSKPTNLHSPFHMPRQLFGRRNAAVEYTTNSFDRKEAIVEYSANDDRLNMVVGSKAECQSGESCVPRSVIETRRESPDSLVQDSKIAFTPNLWGYVRSNFRAILRGPAEAGRTTGEEELEGSANYSDIENISLSELRAETYEVEQPIVQSSSTPNVPLTRTKHVLKDSSFTHTAGSMPHYQQEPTQIGNSVDPKLDRSGMQSVITQFQKADEFEAVIEDGEEQAFEVDEVCMAAALDEVATVKLDEIALDLDKSKGTSLLRWADREACALLNQFGFNSNRHSHKRQGGIEERTEAMRIHTTNSQSSESIPTMASVAHKNDIEEVNDVGQHSGITNRAFEDNDEGENVYEASSGEKDHANGELCDMDDVDEVVSIHESQVIHTKYPDIQYDIFLTRIVNKRPFSVTNNDNCNYDNVKPRSCFQVAKNGSVDIPVCCISAISVILLIFIALVVSYFVFGLGDDLYQLVCLPGGINLIGLQHKDGGIVFKGIPYAKRIIPPLSRKRWSPPVPIKEHTDIPENDKYSSEALVRKTYINLNKDGFKSCWGEQDGKYYQATQFQSKCAQFQYNSSGFISATKDTIGDEDCLYLNVWTPTINNSAHLPVLVWIHGGGLMSSSGNEPGYSPTIETARKLNAVVVSFNYRLADFGFLSLNILSTNGTSSGNYGLMDIIEALKWVRSNIVFFGGNPHDVTVLGEGSGATAILALLTSPSAKNLFSKAWMASGSATVDSSPVEANNSNDQFLAKSGCTTPGCLYRLDKTDVLMSSVFASNPYWNASQPRGLPDGFFNIRRSHLLLVDGHVVPTNTPDAIRSAIFNDIPLVISSSSPELEIQRHIASQRFWDYVEYAKVILNTFDNGQLGGVSRALDMKIRDLYNSQHYGADVDQALADIATDIYLTCPLNHLRSKLAVKLESPVYRLIVKSRPTLEPSMAEVHGMVEPDARATATSDGVTNPGSVKNWLVTAMMDPSVYNSGQLHADDQQFVNLATDLLKTFMYTGQMGSGWLPSNTAIMSNELSIFQSNEEEEYNDKKCLFWKRNKILDYESGKDYGWRN